MRTLCFIRLGRFALFAGWMTIPIAKATYFIYGSGLQIGRFRLDWEYNNYASEENPGVANGHPNTTPANEAGD